MLNLASTVAFYAVLVAPGFVAVATIINLASIEREHSRFTLLVWSLVLSVVIDAISAYIYQFFKGSIQSYNELPGLLFEPGFQVEYIFYVLLLSLFIGLLGTIFVLFEVSERVRRRLQRRFKITVNPRQPWANFVRDTHSIRVKTSDDQLYEGLVEEWSRANRPKELIIFDPQWYDPDKQDYVPVGGESMLFLGDDIDRLVMRESDSQLSLLGRLWDWVKDLGILPKRCFPQLFENNNKNESDSEDKQ